MIYETIIGSLSSAEEFIKETYFQIVRLMTQINSLTELRANNIKKQFEFLYKIKQ